MFPLAVFVALCKTEVNDEDLVSSGLWSADQEVIGFDVSVDNPLIVHFLYATNHLNGDQQHSFQI